MYSTNENIFAYGLLMIEFWPTGAILTYPTIGTVIIDDSDSPFKFSLRIGLRIVLYVYVLCFVYGEYNEIKDVGCTSYVSSCWNLIDILNYALFVVGGVYWVRIYT